MIHIGSEGCIVIPSLKKGNNNEYVTKLFYNKEAKYREINSLQLFKSSHLDDSGTFTITSYDEDPITIPSDIVKKCNRPISGLFINYSYGGVPIKSILTNPNDVLQIKNVIKSLIPIAKFVDGMNSKGYYHYDLHDSNIVYNGKKSYIIDFGNLIKKEDKESVDDFSFGGDHGIFIIIKNIVTHLISNFGEDEVNISEDEHMKFTKFLTNKTGNDRKKMLASILTLESIRGGKRKTLKRKRSIKK